MIDRDDENHELDDFIRQKLNNIQVPFDEQAWLNLREKLQAHNRAVIPPRQAKLTWTRLAAASVLLLALQAFLWAYFNVTQKATNSQIITDQTQTNNSKTQKKFYELNSTDSLTENLSELNPENSTLGKSEISRIQTIKPKEIYSQKEGQKPPFQVNPPSTDTQEPQNHDQALVVQVNTPDSISQSSEKRVAIPFLTSLTSLTGIDLKYPESQNRESSMQYVAIPEHVKEKKWWMTKPLYIGLTYAPEYDVISLAEQNNWTSNTGLMAEWSFSPKLALRAGLSFSHKGYDVIDFDKSPAPTSVNVILNSTNQRLVIAESMSVSSDIIDIPLELKYTFYKGKKINFFMSGGFSTYVYTKQHIEEETDIINPYTSFRAILNEKETKYDQEKFFPLSTFNTSFGIETQVSRHVKAQINPYYKLALRGTGSENIQISSFGVRTLLMYGVH